MPLKDPAARKAYADAYRAKHRPPRPEAPARVPPLVLDETNSLLCQLCDRRVRSIGHHLRRAHDMSSNDYRDLFGIRRSEPLTHATVRARWAESMQQTIASGALDDHFAGNPDLARRANAAGIAAKRGLIAKGVDMPHGTPPLPRATIAAVVARIEGGAKVATAVKAGGMAYSAYHAGLARHPDLKARHDAARSALPAPRRRR